MGTALIVDDNADIRRLIARFLALDDWQVIEAQDGVEGIAAFETHQVDIVISDVFMDRMSGLGLLRELRRRACAVPVVMISGENYYQGIDYLESATSLGAAAILRKPFDRTQFRHAIAVAIG